MKVNKNNLIARNLSFRHLKAFTCVAHHGSFSRAAEELAMSQPALTLTIKQFEDIIGVELFTRTTRSVILTSCGREFLIFVEKNLDDFEQAIRQIRARSQQQENQINIALLPSIAIRFLPAVIQSFTNLNPKIRFQLNDDNGRGVQSQVLSGKADFGLCNQWQPHPDLDFTPILRDQVGLICHCDHPLAQESAPLFWSVLEKFEFIGMADDTAINCLTESRSDLPETISRPAHRVLTIAALVGMIETGDSVSVLPALASPEYLNPSLVYRCLVEPVIYREICLITLRGRPLSNTAMIFLDFFQQGMPRFCNALNDVRIREIMPQS